MTLQSVLSLYLYPILWLVAAIALIALEAATVQLVAIWFALGAMVTMFVSMMGAGLTAQLIVFTLVSVLAMASTRPFLKKTLRVHRVHTNADSIIGTLGTVTEEVNNAQSRGRVHVNGLNWSARSESGESILTGEQVLIKSIEGVKVIVERLV